MTRRSRAVSPVVAEVQPPTTGRRQATASILDATAFTPTGREQNPLIMDYCESGDLNPDPFRDWILSPARLPVPPLSLVLMQKQFRANDGGRQAGDFGRRAKKRVS